RSITFLDTPGHEAFTAMRARGAQVTDIVILVIAADDKVMPQTEEALDHAKAAGVSIVIAINKIDKPGADPNTIKKQLADREILVEDWGGQYQCVEVSAKTGAGIDDLLEKVLLEAELLDLKANPNKRSRGVVIEARLDKGKGPVANVLISAGILNVGDSFVVGQINGKVRAMFDHKGNRITTAGPSVPVQVLGLDGVPEAGDRFIGMEDEREARDVAQRRQQLKREQDFRQVKLMTLDELSKQVKQGNLQELKLVVKADVDGSAQALADSLQRLSTNTIEVQVIRRAVGPIAESDVILAAASNAIIIGFHVRPSVKAKELADREKVDIRLYKVIYDAIEEVEAALEGMLEPIEKEVLLGTVEVRQLFKISRLGTVAGCMVLSGKITRNALVRIVRNDVEIYSGKLSSLKREKDDAKEVNSGFECGLMIEKYNDVKEGDIIEAYEVVQEAQTLKQSRQGAMN
ncbi:MAG: translation initiation factor IF-2, partial [Calditrichota bacterium]